MVREEKVVASAGTLTAVRGRIFYFRNNLTYVSMTQQKKLKYSSNIYPRTSIDLILRKKPEGYLITQVCNVRRLTTKK